LTCSGSFLLGFGGAWGISRIAGQIGLVDKPEDRSSHCQPTPRGGGGGILGALVFSGLLLDLPWMYWVPAACLSLFSFCDDFVPISPRARLLGQFLAVFGFLFPSLSHASLTFGIVIAAFFWGIFIVGAANFYNFMDGIDGMAGITGTVGFSLLALFGHLSGNEINFSVFSICLAAACLGFLPLNIPRARIFLGDVGSILLGFMYGVSSYVFSSSPAEFLVMICFLFPFLADTLSTLFFRWRRGEKLFEAHRQHLYQILANEFGLSHLKVSLIYGFIQAGIGVLALSLYLMVPGWIPLFFLVNFLAITYIFIAQIVRIEAAH